MANKLKKEYWLISAPQKAKNKFAQVKHRVEGSKLGNCFSFDLPDLRIGTLDTLVILSDQLQKDDRYVASVNTKLAKQIYDIKTSHEDFDKKEVTIDDLLEIAKVPIDTWLNKFKWDTGRWDYEKNSLKTITELIQKNVKEMEDRLRVLQQQWSQINNTVAQTEKSTEGSILIRDISDIIKREHIITSDSLTTLLVIVSKYRLQEWFQTYEKLVELYPKQEIDDDLEKAEDSGTNEQQSNNQVNENNNKHNNNNNQVDDDKGYCVVPGSSTVIHEEGNEVLVNVVLFKKHLDLYKKKVLEQKFQVREYQYKEGGTKLREKKIQELKEKRNQIRARLNNFCLVQFAEAFSCWIHLKSIRLWVESVLRYGLPATFDVTLIKPASEKIEGKLRNVLNDLFSDLGGQIFTEDIKATGEEGTASFGISTEKMYSYVSMEVDLHI